MTTDGTLSGARVFHGATSAVTRLQFAITLNLNSFFCQHLLVWLDHLLLYAAVIPILLRTVKELLAIRQNPNLKLHLNKCILYPYPIHCCGLLNSAKGEKFDPRSLEGLQGMEAPTTGGLLQLFYCTFLWVCRSIQNFSNLLAPLQAFLEKIYVVAGNRLNRAVSKICVKHLEWSATEKKYPDLCEKTIASLATLAHRDTTKRLNI